LAAGKQAFEWRSEWRSKGIRFTIWRPKTCRAAWPLSSFDPQALPDPKGKQVVFACRSGKRSVTASLAAQAAGLPYDKHLAGGMLAWKGAGLPTKSGG
jgi:rhodanese-related sulfurtransferase